MRRTQQSVLIHLNGSYSPDSFADLEDTLSILVNQEGVGQLDGNEIGPTETTLFLYGPDAEALLAVIQNTLQQNPLSRNGRVTLRYGGIGSAEKKVNIAT